MKRKREKKSKRSKKDEAAEKDDDSDDSSVDSVVSPPDEKHSSKKSSRHSKKSSKKPSKKKHRKKSSSRRRSREDHNSDDDDDSGGSDSNDSDDSSRNDRHRKKRSKRKDDKKSSKRKSKKHEKSDKSTTKTAAASKTETPSGTISNAKLLANALFRLFTEKPEFADDLPTILIRLAGGTSFDLRQVTDSTVSSGLHFVFNSLSEYGVEQSPESGAWFYSGSKRDERILIRAMQSLLDEAGIDMAGVRKHDIIEEAKQKELQKIQQVAEDARKQESAKYDITNVENHLTKLLKQFFKEGSTLHQELQVLCKDLLDGQSISLDGLPDEALKNELNALFQLCQLEECEMDDDDDDDSDEGSGNDSDSENKATGYCISDSNKAKESQALLNAVIQFCDKAVSKDGKLTARSRMMFPARQGVATPHSAAPIDDGKDDDDSESDDEGPTPFGYASKAHRPALPSDYVKMQADERAKELRSVVTGVTMKPEGGREEWMLVPGKFDILGNIKKGQMKGKSNFENKKSRSREPEEVVVDARIQQQIDSIMDAHASARGPSLMDQHKSKQEKEKEDKAKQGGKSSWTWNRNKDLDKGRRVDKDALQMIMGGAGGDLKTKFQGGYGGN